MNIQSYLTTPGEHALLINGPEGLIEAILTVPNAPREAVVAILGHPHSLHGGSMSNKVVTTLARAFKDENIISLRFNFRGVGRSEGVYDAGIGESEDMLFLAALLQDELPRAQFIFAGFSFGSYVTYRAAMQMPHQLLISVAPAVHHYDYREFGASSDWVVMQGEEDEVVSFAEVDDFVQKTNPRPIFYRYPDTGHFFHGKLVQLKQDLSTLLKDKVAR